DDIGDGQGMLQVDGSTSVYYYVIDETGKQIARQHLNQPVRLGEGIYRVKLNNSLHNVEVWDGYLLKCHTGTLMVSGSTDEFYHVSDSLDHQLAYEKLGKSLSLFGGHFRVKVNSTEIPVNVRLHEMTEVRTGSVVAEGTTTEFYYVLDKNNKQLNFSRLGKPLSFLPGNYRVNINNTIVKADVFAGRTTQLMTGNLFVSGLTDELYYVTDTLGNALNFQKLNNPLALFPGAYRIQVNNTLMHGEVRAGQVTEFNTGSLTLRGSGSEYYYVFDNAGKQLNYNSLNRWLSFFPSEYIVKLGGSTQKVKIVAGQQTSLEAIN
ncbi:MAG TPA: hypothetical protein VFT90_08300, partial [Chryseosolibacter sp.]|nr:hypothetical protein [Chryseosolibacter sp.]